jgi:hypothetical protein
MSGEALEMVYWLQNRQKYTDQEVTREEREEQTRMGAGWVKIGDGGGWAKGKKE